MTTVYFASNRILTGAPDVVASYGPNIQPPSDSTGIIYGSAFVDGIDIASNAQGTITAIQATQAGQFPQAAIDDMSNAGRNLLVFIHGFDNSFSDAVTRAAFNREWLFESGAAAADTTVVAFSWPSLGKIISPPYLFPQDDYLQDQKMARQSATHLMTFLANLEPILTAARNAGRKTFLLAHSMGNLALAGAVESWFLHGNGRATLFDAAFLAAGDARADSFAQPDLGGLSGLPNLASKTCIYYSHADHVLQLSYVVNGGQQRLGQNGPDDRADTATFPLAQYTMVDATGFQDYGVNFLTSHQYYRLSPTCRGLIAAQM